MKTIGRRRLQNRINKGNSQNCERSSGFALINVLEEQKFNSEHIPGSINIPQGHENRFDLLYDKDKELILYSASRDCTKAREVGSMLESKGFRNVSIYVGGVKEWRNMNQSIARGNDSVFECSIF